MIATFAPAHTTLERRREGTALDKPTADASSPQSALSLSVQQATWLFFRKQADLNETEQGNLEQLRHERLWHV